MYKVIFEHAAVICVPFVFAEIDIEPHNPTSLNFHKKFGFCEVKKIESTWKQGFVTADS